MKTRTCSKCGAESTLRSKKCYNCGAPLTIIGKVDIFLAQVGVVAFICFLAYQYFFAN